MRSERHWMPRCTSSRFLDQGKRICYLKQNKQHDSLAIWHLDGFARRICGYFFSYFFLQTQVTLSVSTCCRNKSIANKSQNCSQLAYKLFFFFLNFGLFLRSPWMPGEHSKALCTSWTSTVNYVHDSERGMQPIVQTESAVIARTQSPSSLLIEIKELRMIV